MTMPAFEVILPSSLEEALTFLKNHPGNTKIIAGGTDLVPSLKQKLFEPSYLLDIKPLREIQQIREMPDGTVRIGALVTISEVARDPLIQREFPVLAQAAATVAGPSLRNAGTIGGNICLDTRCYWYNQSYFWRESCGFCIKKDGTLCHVAPGSKQCWAVYSADTAPALITLDAKIRLSSATGERRVLLPDFFINEGAIKNNIRPDEILTEVILPSASRGMAGRYEKYRIRGSVDYPLAGVAVALRKNNGHLDDLRVAITAMNPRPVALPDLVPEVKGKNGTQILEIVRSLAAKTAKPLKTSASTMDYRRHMLAVMIKRSLKELGIS